jgi:hypothetical protein
VASEPDLNAARRRRKRKSQRARRAQARGASSTNPNHTSGSAPLTGSGTKQLGPLSLYGNKTSLNERPPSAGAARETAVAKLTKQLEEAKAELKMERMHTAHQAQQLCTAQNRLATALTAAIANCVGEEHATDEDERVPEMTEASTMAERDEWWEAQTARLQELSTRAQRRREDVQLLQADNSALREQHARFKQEHERALRCMEKLAVNNSLMAQLVDISDDQGRAVDLVSAVDAVRTSSVAAEQEGTLQQMETLEQLIASQLESAKKKQQSSSPSPPAAQVEPAGGADEETQKDPAEGSGGIEQWSWRRSPSPLKHDAARPSTESSPLDGTAKPLEDISRSLSMDDADDEEGEGEGEVKTEGANLAVSPEEEDETQALLDEIKRELGKQQPAQQRADVESQADGATGDAALCEAGVAQKAGGEGAADVRPPVVQSLQLARECVAPLTIPAEVEYVPQDLSSLSLEELRVLADKPLSCEVSSAPTKQPESKPEVGPALTTTSDSEEPAADEQEAEEEAMSAELEALVVGRAERIIASANEGVFRPAGGLGCLSAARVVEALLESQTHAGQAVAMIEAGVDPLWMRHKHGGDVPGIAPEHLAEMNQEKERAEALAPRVRAHADESREAVLDDLQQRLHELESFVGEDEDEDEDEEEELGEMAEEEQDPAIQYLNFQQRVPTWMLHMGLKQVHRPLPPLPDIHDDQDETSDESGSILSTPAGGGEITVGAARPSPDGWYQLEAPSSEPRQCWAMRANGEVLPMVLQPLAGNDLCVLNPCQCPPGRTASGTAAPSDASVAGFVWADDHPPRESLRVMVRPEVAKRESILNQTKRGFFEFQVSDAPPPNPRDPRLFTRPCSRAGQTYTSAS